MKDAVGQFHDEVEVIAAACPASTVAGSPLPECSPDGIGMGSDLDEPAVAIMNTISGSKGGLALLANARGWLARREQEFGGNELVTAFSHKLDAHKIGEQSIFESAADIRTELKVLLGTEKFMNAKTKALLANLRPLCCCFCVKSVYHC